VRGITLPMNLKTRKSPERFFHPMTNRFTEWDGPVCSTGPK